MKTILAFAGPKGVGKTTMARKLHDSGLLPGKSTVLSFADPLKAMARVLLPTAAFTHENKEKFEFGLCGKSPRYILQTLGTEWGRRMIGENIWCETLVTRIHDSTADFVLIDDLRFLNEARILKHLGASIILLSREGIEYTGEHESEVPLPPELIKYHIDVMSSVKDVLIQLDIK